MSDTASGNDWELVSEGLSSHPSSASSSSDAGADGAVERGAEGGGEEGAHDGIGTVDSGVGSGYFLCNPSTPSLPLEFLGVGEVEQFDVMKPTGVPSEAPSDDSFTVEDAKRKQVEELDFSRGILMPDSCTTQLHELSKLDWMEPRPPGNQLLEFEGSELGSTSNPDVFAPEIKARMERELHQVGPLLGSCMSAPSSPTIVSRDNSFRLSLSDEMVGRVIGGDDTSQRGCSIEVEPDTLAAVEHEMLLAHSAFISPDSVADMNKIGVSSKESSASALEDEHAVETWWNKPVHGRQASTYWSFALAAAVMGLVILGHRWQYERRQNHQLRLRLIAKEEKIGQLVLQLARLKEALSGRRRVPVLRSGSYLNDSFDRY
ncbi:uncharacterized protein [Physcomitrium patens]|uniref:uncharacterized protein isoform X2 n=1 Tax=Physcomitrium patens TaxID=3218 RepID=UPI00024B1DC6|nr:uncharacterized protein LOC112292487 isoform X2 [Physcomitrium patens]|eukprot:XP_024396796.1 uncharacterized protein LOC112292487 isoform X2 [Physcomitrella patens]